jgi:hypothetical protein
MARSLDRRQATLYTLLRATLHRSGASTVEYVPLTDVRFFQGAVLDDNRTRAHPNGAMVSFNGFFRENLNVWAPFNVVFIGARQVSGVQKRMAVTGAISIQNQFRALMAILLFLVTTGALKRHSFDETVHCSIESSAGQRNNFADIADGFCDWAVDLIQRSALDGSERQQAVAELIAFDRERVTA